MGALHTWDKLLEGFSRPLEGKASEELSHWKLDDIIASQFEGTLAADALLGIAGKGREAIDFFKDG